MDTGSMFGIMDIIIVAAGVYILYAWYLLMFKGEIREGGETLSFRKGETVFVPATAPDLVLAGRAEFLWVRC